MALKNLDFSISSDGQPRRQDADNGNDQKLQTEDNNKVIKEIIDNINIIIHKENFQIRLEDAQERIE